MNRCFLCATIAAVAALTLSEAAAQDPKLKYPQEQALKSGEGRMTDVEKAVTQLESTLEKLKAGKPTPDQAGSELKRIAPQEQKMDAVLEDLKKNKVPDEHSRAVALKGRIDKAREKLGSLKKELETLRGSAPPEPDASKDPELSSKQRDTVKRAGEFIAMTEKDTSQIAAQLEKARISGNINGVKQACKQQLYDIDKSLKGLGAAAEDLKTCPESHSRVVALKAGAEQATAALAAMRKEFEAIEADTIKAMDVATYPDYEKDLARLKAILGRYMMDPRGAHEKPDALARLLVDDRELQSRVQTLREFYGRYLTAGTKESTALAQAFKALDDRVPRFRLQLKELMEKHEIATSNAFSSAKHWAGGAGADAKSQESGKKALARFLECVALFEAVVPDGEPSKKWRAEYEALVKSFQDQVAEAKQAAIDQLYQKLAGQLAGIEGQKAAEESGTNFERIDGLIDAVGSVEKDLGKLVERAGKDDARVREIEQRCAALKESLPKTRAAVRQRYLETSRAPQEVYEGADKEKLRGMIAAEWKKLYPQDKVLEIRAHMAEWERNVSWKSNETEIYKVDVSAIAFLVIVQTSDTIATTYPAYVNLDNLTGKQTVGAETKGRAYIHREVLLANLNK